MAADATYREVRPGRVVFLLVVAGLISLVIRPDEVSPPEDRAGAPVAAPSSGQDIPSIEREPTSALQPGLVDALARARADAAQVGLEIPVASGFRTVDEQLEELADAIEKYGSREEAERWVFPPDKSAHTVGLAVDIGSGPAADWLEANGQRYGICKTLAWEWWHFEWRRSWEEQGGCPTPAATPEDAPSPTG